MSMTIAPAQVDREATELPIEEIAAFLQAHLGQRITAYVAGVSDRKMVGRWIAGKHAPRPLTTFRLRSAYQAARMLTDAYDDDTAKAWMFGTNSRLDERAPAFVLRNAEEPDEMQLVVATARAFAGAVA